MKFLLIFIMMIFLYDSIHCKNRLKKISIERRSATVPYLYNKEQMMKKTCGIPLTVTKVPPSDGLQHKKDSGMIDWVVMNQHVTYSYNYYGRQLQAVATCSENIRNREAIDDVNIPVWFTLAAHGSRAAGKGIYSADSVLRGLRMVKNGATTQQYCNHVDRVMRQETAANSVSRGIVESLIGARELISDTISWIPFVDGDTSRFLMAITSHLMVSTSQGMGSMDMEYIGNLLTEPMDQLWPFMQKFGTVIQATSGTTFLDKAINFVTTFRDMFGKGNLDIHNDMAMQGQKYLEWRHHKTFGTGDVFPSILYANNPLSIATPNAETALLDLPRIMAPHVTNADQEAKNLFDLVFQHVVLEGNEVKFGWHASGQFSRFSRPSINEITTPVAYALIELAGGLTMEAARVDYVEGNHELRQRLIRSANQFIFYTEQAVKVQPAFALAPKAIHLITPFFGFQFSGKTYSFLEDYKQRHTNLDNLPQENWANLNTRYPVINRLLSTLCYVEKATMWKQPNFNVAGGFDEVYNTENTPVMFWWKSLLAE